MRPSIVGVSVQNPVAVCVQASGNPACVQKLDRSTQGAQPSVGQAASQMVSQSPFLLLLVLKEPQQCSCLAIWLQVGGAKVWRGPSAWNLPAIKAWSIAHGEAVRTADIELLGEAPYESAEGRAALLLALVPGLTNMLVRQPVTGLGASRT